MFSRSFLVSLISVTFIGAIVLGIPVAGIAQPPCWSNSPHAKCQQVAPVGGALPTISGTTTQGQTLQASDGNWSGTQPMTYAYQWKRCNTSGGSCSAVSGATAQSYALGAADVGSTLRVTVTASNSYGTSSADSSATSSISAASSPPPPPSPSPSSIYWGAYIDGNDTYSYLYGGTWRDAPWDSNTWSKFESNAGKKVSVVHWGLAAPWTHDFTYYQGSFNLVQNAGDLNAVDMSTGSVSLSDIAAGVYDSSIKTWFQEAAAWGHPFYLIPDAEMNGTWEPYSPGQNGNTATSFVSAWRHMHDLAAQAGATNVTWVWAPNVDPNGMFTPYNALYPGDSYVDWTGLDGYNKSGTQSFSWLYGSSYKALLQMAPNKPIMITQIGSVEGGNGKAAWITDALSQLPTNFPQIKALLWFNWRIYENGGWWNWEIESSASSQQAFANGIGSAYYAPGGTLGQLPLGSKVQAR